MPIQLVNLRQTFSPDPAGFVMVEAVEHGVAEVLLRRGRRGHHRVGADFSQVHLTNLTF